MSPRLRSLVILSGSGILAVFLGVKLANAEYFWPGLALVIALTAILARLSDQPVDVIFVGVTVAGYIVGNRGFAQLTPPGFPLFPAEAALLIAGGWRLVAWAIERRLPLRREALTVLVLAWLVVGSARFVFDFRVYGLAAARDFAMVYYAAFYFIALDMAREPRARRFLLGSLVVALAALVFVAPLYEAFPEFLLRTFQVGGVPLIYFKGDLLNTYLAAAAIVLFHVCPVRAQRWLLPVTATLFAWVFFGGNRASALALGLVSVALFLGGQRRFATMHFGFAVAAAIVVLGLATVGNNDWAERRVRSVQDRAMSVLDPRGTAAYRSEDSANKGDNNRFRLIWWRNVLEETWRTNPVLGLGFGHDLAAGFVREYYPEAGEEFSTRSPHNIFVTVAGRLGLLGVLVWTALCAVAVRALWRVVRAGDAGNVAAASLVGLILVSSCFGVVLEGPMGAVPFWVALGLANSLRDSAREEPPNGREV